MERTFSDYLLFVDSKVSAAYQSLEEAKRASTQFIENKCAIRIENPTAHGLVSAWRYDYDVKDWVAKSIN